MARARKACGEPGCPELTRAAYCDKHAPAPWAGSTRAQRLPSDWKRRRRAVLARDPICRVCTNALSTQADHIVPGDDHSLSNLQGICDACHATKTQAEAAAARGGRR